MIMDKHLVNKELLTSFIDNFFGYGNLESPYWFIGKEEGGDRNLVDNYKRIFAWEDLGRPTTVDLIDYHFQLGFPDKEINHIQSTWTKLTQILLTMEDKEGTKEERRYYQRNRLGRLKGNNCCIELMPMPSRSTGLWLWEQLFQDYYHLNNRQEYFSSVVPRRIHRLKEMIAQNVPKLVVFYSMQKDYIEKWQEIAGEGIWQWVQISRVMKYGWLQNDTTLYIIVTHPTMKGITNKDFPVVGEFIKKIL